MVLAFFGLTLGMLWERSTVINSWHYLCLPYMRRLYKCFRHVFVPSTRPIKEFLESEWPLNQSIEEWV
ncbi:hypothetical protein Gogos_021218 [Gossypium gossypioides]|uniref:Secreted protein n=1 Tax=Gossypium gossypioides TaxID=34282 RepID=A0A7J9D527_GOSGO|nr:hypothetical protein [Gossypium gossypioides]